MFLKMSVLSHLHAYNCRYPQLAIMVNYYQICKHFATYARSHFPRESLVKATGRIHVFLLNDLTSYLTGVR